MTLLMHRCKAPMNEAKERYSDLAAKDACDLLINFP